MNELLTWLMANWGEVAGVVAVLLALLYAASKGVLLDKLGQAWGVIVAMAKEVLASIPEGDFEIWARMIYESLPTWARVFTSVGAIKALLMRWRDLLVAKWKQQDVAGTRKTYWALRPDVMAAVEAGLT